MERRGFNQADAARFLDFPEPVVSKMKDGLEGLGLARAIRVERLTGIPVEAWASELELAWEPVGAASGKRKVSK